MTAPVVRPDREAVRASTAPIHLMQGAGRSRFQLPLTPLLLSAFVLHAGVSAVSPLTNAATGQPAHDATLALSIWYMVFAPFCDTLDMLSLFSQSQHFVFLATCALSYAGWRGWRHNRRRAGWSILWKESAFALLGLTAVVALYAAGMLLPRPTAALAMASSEAVVVDFHSHTRFSWDGRAAFTPEESRRWHHASGFDAAYVTDHGTFAGAAAAAARNPSHARDGTVLLSGIEVRSMGRHLNVLGTTARDSAAFESGNLDEETFLRSVRAGREVPPIVLLTLPGNLNAVKGAVPIDAIEVSDGAPRALAQIDRERARLLDVGESQRIAMVSGSNNHGWAGASPAWSVLQIPGWQSMTPPELDTAIRRAILDRGSDAVTVVERRPAGPASSYRLAWTVPLAIWRLFTSVTWPERTSWLLWIWTVYFTWHSLAAARKQRQALVWRIPKRGPWRFAGDRWTASRSPRRNLPFDSPQLHEQAVVLDNIDPDPS